MATDAYLQPPTYSDLALCAMSSRGPMPTPSPAAIASAFSSSRRVGLNVGGSRHEVMWRTLQRLPRTRLGRLETCRTHADLLSLCDDYTLPEKQADGRWSLVEFYFERHTRSFALLLDLYRTGRLHVDDEICVMSFRDELEYWGIDQLYIEPCCEARFHQRFDQMEDEIRKEADYAKAKEIVEDFGSGPCASWRKVAWYTMEKPETSRLAHITAIVSISFVLLSTVILTLNTIPELAEDYDEKKMKNFPTTINLTTNQPSNASSSYEKRSGRENRYLAMGEYVCITWFTLEYIIRIWACPSKFDFLWSPLNWIDLLSILPFYISLAIQESSRAEAFDTVGRVIQVFRIMRVLRILKLARHFTGLQSLGYTLQRSYKELGLLVLFLAIGVLLFSSICYYCEKDLENTKYNSIPATFWWAAVSMTTVGYGDMTPTTVWGKLVASLCCVCGVLVIALPNPVIVNNFIEYYQELRQREKMQKRREELEKRRLTMKDQGSRDFINLDKVFARSIDFINRLRDSGSRENTPTRGDYKSKSIREFTPESEGKGKSFRETVRLVTERKSREREANSVSSEGKIKAEHAQRRSSYDALNNKRRRSSYDISYATKGTMSDDSKGAMSDEENKVKHADT